MKIVFAGTPEVGAIALRELAKKHEVVLVITRPDAPVGRKRVLTPSPVASAAQELGLTVMKSSKVAAAEIAAIEEAQAELGVIVAYGALLGTEALGAIPWWNLHFSLLPQFRGATPLQHSILHGTGQGITVFRLDSGMDTGEILAAAQMSYPTDQTAGDLLPALGLKGASMILDLIAEPAKGVPQEGLASPAPKLTRSDARLDFAATAESLGRMVMAMNPEPMAWCEFGGEPLRVLRASAVGSVDWSALGGLATTVGQVESSGEKVLVTCGEGTRLELIEVQPSGKRVMSAQDWFRGQQGGIRLD